MKRLLWIVPLVIVVVIIAFVSYLKFALPNIGKAPTIKIEITPERVARGKYLAITVMSCVDCHSQRDFKRFAGPATGNLFAGGGEEFTIELGAPGNFYAPNLTPYHLKDWTDGEIFQAITSGVSKDGRALFPAMPYLSYGKVSQEDIYSVIAYLRTLPTHERTVPTSKPKFPFSLIMNTIPQKPQLQPMPDKNDLVKYGGYMMNLAACYDCHTEMQKGKYIENEGYAGNQEFILPTGTVRSANITPDTTTGIGAWTEETFLLRFKAYGDSTFVPYEVKEGFNTVMPWIIYAHMDEYDLKAIYAYLRTIKPVKKQVIKFTPND